MLDTRAPAAPLCRLAALPDGDARGFDPGGEGHDTLFVVRQGADVRAWRDACPHHGTPLAWRRHAYLNADRSRIVCSAHGAQFDIRSGECTLGPALGQALTAVPLHINDNGEIHLAPAAPQETTP